MFANGRTHRITDCFRFALFVLAAVGVTACSAPNPPSLLSASDINAGLHYFSWDDFEAFEPGKKKCLGAINVQPGMKVALDFVPLARRGDNYAIQAPSHYEWISPAPGEYATDDWFVLTYLLSMGQFEKMNTDNEDAWSVYKAVGQDEHETAKANPPSFYQNFADETMKVLTTMRMEVVRHTPCPAESTTADSMRNWLTRPGHDDFNRPAPDQPAFQLVSDFRGMALYVGGWNTPFFLDEGSAAPSQLTDNNQWFLDDEAIYLPRGFPSLQVAVRIGDDISSRFVPLYYSMQDLERRLGIKVNGFRRSMALLPEEPHTPSDPAPTVETEHLQARDGYFTVWFDRGASRYGAKQTLVVESALKADLLVGHGDVILLGARLSASDRPEQR